MAKNNLKQIASYQQNPWILLAMGLVFAGITYGLGSWAVDSGAITLYGATIVGAYLTIRSLIRGVKKIIRN